MALFSLFLHSRRALMRLPALLRNERVPRRLKIVALVVALLIVSPLNVLGDIPFLGILDDAALLALLLNWFVGAAERYAAPDTIPGDDLVTPR
ncbi:MAG TPA: hypothetical protein VFB22_07685 [Candidatus Baltobacteraceae bacterium]|nr:hypothetical protein [Candidatus Baltobacteraceae bacterium]